MAITNDLMGRKEAARYLSAKGLTISPSTLASMAANKNAGHGPPFTRYGWSTPVKYHRQDLDDWLAKRAQRVE